MLKKTPPFKQSPPITQKRVAVLISGLGTNLNAIIDYVKVNRNQTALNLVLVVSSKADAPGLTFALQAGIPTKVLVYKKGEQTREQYDELLHQILTEANIELVCLAGFMRLLSPSFVNRWFGQVVNIHPSLLPAFKGMPDAYGQALAAGVKITGCTVHFVVAEMDAGPIIEQDVVRIQPNDTHETLRERGKAVEHQVYPKALELVAQGKVAMSSDGKLVLCNPVEHRILNLN